VAARRPERARHGDVSEPGTTSEVDEAPESLEPIPITKAVFGEEELRAVQLPLETGWVVQGPHVAEFERLFADYTGTGHAAATSSCTTALHLAVAALGLGRGDEVVVPAFTWVSTANVVEYTGARPVFCDVDLATFNVDAASVAAATTERTAGLIPVHLFGLCAPIEEIVALARQRGLWVVEDAACAFGGWVAGRHAGTFGDAGCFSFHPRKSITTGEGGMVTTASAGLDRLVRSLRDHGATRTDLARHHGKAAFLLAEYPHVGFNFRLTDIQGALGVAQMHRADDILAARRERAARYDELLADVEWLRTPAVPDGFVHGYQAYVCLFAPEEPTLANVDALHERRNELMLRLEQRGIATRQGTHAPVILDVYAQRYGLRREEFPNAVIADRLTLALPLYPQLTDADQERVVSELRTAYR
jgi:dTDP-4-amino-4,6-dideoxygalactose transaminase